MAVADDYKEFQEGTIVEVSFDDEGLRGSWYTATVIRPTSPKINKKKMLVEYHSLIVDKNKGSSKPLRELVDSNLVRPIPPRESTREFQLMDDVDAFRNDGWWEGVVTQVLEGSRYSVYFPSSRRQIDFSVSDLRLHREWIGGNHWDPPLDPLSQSLAGLPAPEPKKISGVHKHCWKYIPNPMKLDAEPKPKPEREPEEEAQAA